MKKPAWAELAVLRPLLTSLQELVSVGNFFWKAAMTDIDIRRKIEHRLLAELNRVIAELISLEDHGSLARVLEHQSEYQKKIT